MRAAAELLMTESAALRLVLNDVDPAMFDVETVCTGWSVRDVLAHCGAALTMTVSGDSHAYTPEDNQRDVEVRKDWPISDVLDELYRGYESAASAIDSADGALDGIAVGEWIHGGDVREAVGAANPYTSAGVDLAVGLLLERSRSQGRPSLSVILDDEEVHFGMAGPTRGALETDTETFVRMCGGRLPDASRYVLSGAPASDLVLFG